MTRITNRIKPTAFLILVGLMLGLATPAQARDTEIDGSPIDRDVYRVFEGNWRKYARFVCKAADTYGVIPAYDRRYDSSLGMSATQYMRETKLEREIKQGNLVRKQSVSYPREDAEAYVRALPSADIGAYGYVVSAEVVEVINNNEMLVKNLWLVDQDKLREQYAEEKAQLERRMDEGQAKELLEFNYTHRIKLKALQDDRDAGFEETFRLVGYETRGLRVGDRWAGPNNEGFQVGVIKWEVPEPEADEDNRRRTRRSARADPRLLLAAIEQPMREGVDEEGFKKLLAERGMTVAEFVELMRVLRERDRRNAEERILNALMPPAKPEDD